jgi:hypothetical protein
MGYTLEALSEIGKMLGVLPSSAKTSASFMERAYWFLGHEIRGTRNAGLPFLKHEAIELGKKAVEKFTGKKSDPE